MENVIPNQLSIANNQISRLTLGKISTSEVAIKHFEYMGGDRLTRVKVYGADTFEAHPHMKILRKQSYCEHLPVIKNMKNKIREKRLYLKVVSTTFLLVFYKSTREHL